MKYDYLIIGSGLYGSVSAQILKERGLSVLVIDKRNHIGGNCYTEKRNGINVHKYGPHIFHTSNQTVWKYINRFIEFQPFQLNVVANYQDSLYNLPFNMNTFHQMWGVVSPEQAKEKIESQKYRGIVTNLEEHAISMVGQDIYEKLIHGYTKKQWGKDPRELPSSIIKRLPVRYTFDNNYFNDTYQGIPTNGYAELFEKLLDDVEIELDVDYFQNREYWNKKANNIIYTGKIDEFFDYEYGELEYRSLSFSEYEIPKNSYQGTCIVTYTDIGVSQTRITEHKHFDKKCSNQSSTIISVEFPCDYNRYQNTPYYPINTANNASIYSKYKKLADDHKTTFGGRLAKYKYIDMDQTIGMALADLNYSCSLDKDDR